MESCIIIARSGCKESEQRSIQPSNLALRTNYQNYGLLLRDFQIPNNLYLMGIDGCTSFNFLCLSLKQGQLLPFPETLLNNSNSLVVDILTRKTKNIKQSHPSPEKMWPMTDYIQWNQFKASGQSWETHKTREAFSSDTSMTGALENWSLLDSRALRNTNLIAICH